MTGRRTHDTAHHRHESREPALRLKVAGASSARITGLRRAMPGAFQEHHQRNSFAPSDIGEAPPFATGGRADRPAECGEVFCPDGDGTAVHKADARNERIGRHGSGERTDLGETSRVEEFIEPLTGIEATRVVSSTQLFGTAHPLCGGASRSEIVEGVIPVMARHRL